MWLVRGGGQGIQKSQGSRDVPHCVGGLQGNEPVGGRSSGLDDSYPLSLLLTLRRLWYPKSSGPQRKPLQGHPEGHLFLGNFLSTKFRFQGTVGGGRGKWVTEHWTSISLAPSALTDLAQVVISVQ